MSKQLLDVSATKLIRGNLPCPKHGGSDSVALYEGVGDRPNHWHCFSCGAHGIADEKTMNYFEENANMDTAVSHKPTPLGLIQTGRFRDLKDPADPWGYRGISAITCEKFGVKVWEDDEGKRNLVLPYYNEKGDIIAQKVRKPDIITGKKNFHWYKAHDNASKDITFFGQQLWAGPSGRTKTLTVVCGELDALAVYEMMGDWPVVSVPNGDQSVKSFFAKYYTYLDKWDNIVYIPDNDDSGRGTIEEAARMFMRKLKVCRLQKYKDPNEYLQNGAAGAFKDLWFSAQPYMPEKIIPMHELMQEYFYKERPKPIATYPFEGLNKYLRGIYPSDIVLILAPPGSGKTTLTATMAHHFVETTKVRIGLVYLEETKQDLVFRFATLELGVNMQIEEHQEAVSKETLDAVIRKYSEMQRLDVVDHGDTCSTEFIEQKFRELVLARGCEVIIFDHISMAIADESNKDERIALDRALYSIRALMQGGIQETLPDGTVKEFHPALILVSHVNDQGRSRGSRAAEQVANVVLSLERDRKALTAEERNTTTVWCSKNRRFGTEGPAAMLYYNSTSGCLEDRSDLLLSAENGETEDTTPVMDKARRQNDGSFKYT